MGVRAGKSKVEFNGKKRSERGIGIIIPSWDHASLPFRFTGQSDEEKENGTKRERREQQMASGTSLQEKMNIDSVAACKSDGS
jgi:hypothetical protein